ncbi:MAG TPA: transcription elongation factor GreA [Candidatus Magasanikbacteria bacterium]|nr:transcription elongation factor GreA [Candidatus Magasanikbacteria bacterium]
MQTPYRKLGKYAKQTPDPFLSKDKIVEIERKLARLKKTQPQAAAEVSRLAELGDFSENVEYQLAKGRLRSIINTILKLENQLRNAVLIEPEKGAGRVSVGNTVRVSVGGIDKMYQILGSAETNPQKGIISHNSPIGSALIGHQIGDIVSIDIAGKHVEYKILKIE